MALALLRTGPSQPSIASVGSPSPRLSTKFESWSSSTIVCTKVERFSPSSMATMVSRTHPSGSSVPSQASTIAGSTSSRLSKNPSGSRLSHSLYCACDSSPQRELSACPMHQFSMHHSWPFRFLALLHCFTSELVGLGISQISGRGTTVPFRAIQSFSLIPSGDPRSPTMFAAPPWASGVRQRLVFKTHLFSPPPAVIWTRAPTLG
mmetsp:Transcript_7090/g.16568  ORF Transcript_7090/g.16568 Transcript_7090/m.16568 type:complete len:206 (-) Transcript_7090:3756-4373(-)